MHVLIFIKSSQECVQKIDRKLLLESLHPIKEASFNSNTNKEDGPCLPRTRKELLSQVAVWAKSPSSKCIFWLEGMAGTGKSTVPRTVAASFQMHITLPASFFFKQDTEDLDDARRLCSAIARRLAFTIPGLACSIERQSRTCQIWQ